MRLTIEIAGAHRIQDGVDAIVVEENRAEHGLFGLDILRRYPAE